MLQEAYRHAKAIGAWGDGVAALTEAGVASDAPGIVLGDTPEAVFAQVDAHRLPLARSGGEAVPNCGHSGVERADCHRSGTVGGPR
ncbi:hypothetical protein Aglo01_29810 [Actinokineospora globicatena]|nr:hypothetical protein [Actinokineospora globicatena]GLW78499.1 hypothetical protein Aglo01_29810 [Actinokineospora globicatena]GLW84837.1 hypothetical protein Aglo02_24770 [Actinokineospora globicatena]